MRRIRLADDRNRLLLRRIISFGQALVKRYSERILQQSLYEHSRKTGLLNHLLALLSQFEAFRCDGNEAEHLHFHQKAPVL
ncbi:hypothetical protein CW304_07495 [Bacillus sp. UFRGS-B20]|nr:hypothetical protein CW304_07495 [Bacillus sp. UFRGS-B20]